MSQRNATNKTALEKGFKVAKILIAGHIYDILENAARAYLQDMASRKEYQGFTGNTQTSYTCGLYIDGRLTYAIVQDTYSSKPVRLKVGRGETVYLENPYEGKARAVTGEAKVDNRYGKDTAFSFLKSYKKTPKKGLAVVVTTGTEYSEYIENVRNLNVMTETRVDAKPLFTKQLKPMK